MRMDSAIAVSRQQVMLLDDDEDMLDLLKLALESRGLSVRGFSTEQALFAALAHAHPALVITDLQLDQGDGLDVCRRMTESYPDIALVVLSGDASQHRAALERGAALFLTKPVPAQTLGEAVVRLLTLAEQKGADE